MSHTHTSALSIKRLALLCLLFMALGIHWTNAQEITFFTPRTVHIVKAKENAHEQSSVVVTAQPEKVKVRKTTTDGTTTYSTSALTVKVEAGKVSFYDNQGNLQVAEGQTLTPAEILNITWFVEGITVE